MWKVLVTRLFIFQVRGAAAMTTLDAIIQIWKMDLFFSQKFQNFHKWIIEAPNYRFQTKPHWMHAKVHTRYKYFQVIYFDHFNGCTSRGATISMKEEKIAQVRFNKWLVAILPHLSGASFSSSVMLHFGWCLPFERKAFVDPEPWFIGIETILCEVSWLSYM